MSKPVPLYQLMLEDYATPSFYSGSKPYFGTQKQILRHLDRREDKEFLTAAQRYFDGAGDGVAHMRFWLERIVSPVERLGRVPFRIDNFSATFYNIWDCPYQLQAKQVEGTLHYLRREDGVCLRVLQAVFTGLEMVGGDGQASAVLPLRPPFWGYPNMIYRRGAQLKSRLLLLERHFNSHSDALADLSHPAKPCFDAFFEDIFGDG